MIHFGYAPCMALSLVLAHELTSDGDCGEPLFGDGK